MIRSKESIPRKKKMISNLTFNRKNHIKMMINIRKVSYNKRSNLFKIVNNNSNATNNINRSNQTSIKTTFSSHNLLYLVVNVLALKQRNNNKIYQKKTKVFKSSLKKVIIAMITSKKNKQVITPMRMRM